MSRRSTTRNGIGRARPRRRTRNRRNTKPLWKRVSVAGIGRSLWSGLSRGRMLWLAAGVVGAVGGAGYGGYYFLTHSDRFDVDELVIKGAGEHEDAARSIATGALGKNVFRVDLEALERQVLALPAVRRARVRRELPGRITVDVGTHVAAGVVSLGSLYAVDAEGEVFQRIAQDGDDILAHPIITGIPRERYIDNGAAAKSQIRRALRLAELYKSDDSRPALSEVNYSERTGFSLVTYDSGTQIRLGAGEAPVLEKRLRSFDATWSALEPEKRRSATTIYVDDETRPERVIVAFAQVR